VLEAAREIPFGEARPYAWVARRIGRPRAVRAVGTALARNPVPLVIPCHRVVRSDGTPGEYALGAAMKRRLHALEEATPRLEGCTSTRIVCRVGCAHGRRMRPANRIVFASVGDARALGYRACRTCRPAAAAYAEQWGRGSAPPDARSASASRHSSGWRSRAISTIAVTRRCRRC
jgi:O-6-methylguanine DNA methyltransferase